MASSMVLVVDDEKNITELARLYLSNEGFRVDAAYGGLEALEKSRRLKPDLVVLDLMMPDLDGKEVCRQLRKDHDVPIIILSARDDIVDKVVGLELGADDYLTKPFDPRELVARVKAVLRRHAASVRGNAPIRVAELEIDVERRDVRLGERVIDLRPKEFDLLVALARSPGIVFDRERLLQLAWGYDYLGDSRTIDVHITWLRDKLKGGSISIQTVRGVGYKLVAPGA